MFQKSLIPSPFGVNVLGITITHWLMALSLTIMAFEDVPGLIKHLPVLVKMQITISPLARVLLLNIELLVPAIVPVNLPLVARC